MSIYYLTKFSTDANEIGDFPQCIDFEKGLPESKIEKFYEANAYYNFEKGFVRPKLSDLNGLKLWGRAKKTDILSQAMTEMLLVNEKALSVIEQFNLGEYEVIPATVIRRKVPMQYFFLFYLSGFKKYIDMPECEFQSED